MDVLKTIEEVFKFNVRKLRAGRTQEEVSDGTRIPFRTYQTMEAGIIPAKKENLLALARFHGVGETEFFLDPDLTKPTAEQALQVITEAIESLKKQPKKAAFQHIDQLTDDEREMIQDVIDQTIEGRSASVTEPGSRPREKGHK